MYKANIVLEGDGPSSIVIISSEGKTYPLNSSHPNYDAVYDALVEGFPDEVYDDGDNYISDYELEEQWLIDHAGNALTPGGKQLVTLSERAAFDGNHILWDGDEINTNLARHIVRTLNAGEDAAPVVAFMENLATNPSSNARHRLWNWMQDRDFTITPEGLFVAYKGVRADDLNSSITAGKERVLVNGEEHFGHIPNPVGAVVNMPRALVDPDINNTCSVGLHVGTFEYAKDFGQRLLTVLVNPRDVVEVPTDCNGQKIRTCRYIVMDAEVQEEFTAPTLHVTEDEVTRGSDTWDDEPEVLYEY